MANSRVKSAGWSTNEKLTSVQATALDLGQYRALCRTGTTPLLGATTIEGGGFALSLDFSDDAASQGAITIGQQDFVFGASGAGLYSFPGANFNFSGSSWPSTATKTITGYTPPISSHFSLTEYDIDVPYAWKQIVDTTPVLAIWLTLPAGVVIKSLSVPFRKTNGTWPFTMPTIGLYYHDLAANTSTTVCGPTTDSAANLTAFQAYHTVTTPTVSHTVAADRNYFILITGDGDSSPTDFLRVYRPKLTVEVAQIRTL